MQAKLTARVPNGHEIQYCIMKCPPVDKTFVEVDLLNIRIVLMHVQEIR